MSTLSATSRAVESFAAPDPFMVRIRDLIYQVAGIFHADNKLRALEERCMRRMQVLAIKTFRDYYDCLTIKSIRQAELVALLNEITIGETCFFRNQPQMDGIRNIVLPKIVEQRANLSLRHLRIWSAGCSTGEEPYTLCMIMLEETATRLKGWTFEILATDLNERSLTHAKNGVYNAYSTRNLPAAFREKYFAPSGNDLQIDRSVKSHVNFSRVNLTDETKMLFMKGLDIVLCCNVLIYFDGASKKRVIQHFYNDLLPHGYLFLGHSESLYGVSEDFRLVHMPSSTAYVKAKRGV